MRKLPASVFLLLFLMAGCVGRTGESRFAEQAAPILERHCLSTICHGVAPDAKASGEVLDPRFLFITVDGAGHVADTAAAYATVRSRLDTTERIEYSTLLRKPLAVEAGGVAHEGGHQFESRDDADFAALLNWASGESGGGEGGPLSSLTPLEQQFGDEVLPVLRDRGCMAARCHGPLTFFGGLQFVPPMDGVGGGFSVADIKTNHLAALHNAALGGDATRSRLLCKALPLDAGGTIHRGGNDLFFPHADGADPRSDPGAQAIVRWVEAERKAAVAPDAPDAPTGIVFVRGPIAPHDFTDVQAFRPGSDVWYYPSLAPGAAALNLTAAAHAGGPADVRDPSVTHDGKAVLFAMRTSADDCHNLYRIQLDGSGLERLTSDTGTLAGGGKVVNRWPSEGPKGRVFFASTRAGTVDQTGRSLDVDLYELRAPEAPGGMPTPVRLSYTPTPELSPSFLAVGEFRGTLAFTVIRDSGDRWRAPIFRFPPDRNPLHPQADYHPHHGQTVPSEASFHIRELPDGRDVVVMLDRGNQWEGGGLAVIERQLGPDVTAAQMANLSVPGFMHAVSVIDRAAASSKKSLGMYRDPAPLPDGRLVVSYAAGAIDLNDPAARPDTGLYLLTLGTQPDGSSTVAKRDLLVDAAGLADDQPAVVYARPEEDDVHDYAWDDSQPRGEVNYIGGLPLEAILGSLPPVGPKPFRTDIVGVRVYAWPATKPSDNPPIDPSQIANHDSASTWWSNGAHPPAILVAEAPFAADGSIYASAPAGVPVRAQTLDADNYARGNQLQIWVYVLGAQKLTVGVNPKRYTRLCAGCHGSTSGRPEDALPPPTPGEADVVSGASTTLATFKDGNPRLPLPSVALATGALPTFHFRRDLGPILSRSCAVTGCHAGASPKGGLDLTPRKTTYYDSAYEALQAFGDGSTGGKKYLDERGASAFGSYLMEKIAGRELGAPRTLDFQCPPAGSGVPGLSTDEVKAFARWIDLGAIYRTPGVVEP